ncbi:MAG: DUF5320 domain-containing protein [Clostridiaceae bacterium]|nr:DUF5320 domain-containing protein [Clostridiaceae bacterium]
MPRRDGTGPMGAGAMTGRGLGPCNDDNYGTASYRRGRGRAAYGCGMGRGAGYGRGFGYRNACGRGFYMDQEPAQSRKEFLQERKNYLQSRLEVIDDELDNLEE